MARSKKEVAGTKVGYEILVAFVEVDPMTEDCISNKNESISVCEDYIGNKKMSISVYEDCIGSNVFITVSEDYIGNKKESDQCELKKKLKKVVKFKQDEFEQESVRSWKR